MKATACAAAFVLAGTTVSSSADDSDKQAKTPWDIAFGGALMSDYNFRGISASDHRPAASAYVEPRYDFSRSLQAYVNVTTNSLMLPNHAASSVEIYGGVRPTFDRLALDFGFWEHWLPGGLCFNFQAPGGLCVPQTTELFVNSVPAELSYWEVYGKATYSVDRQLSFGARVDWTPSVLNSDAEATYVAGWGKYILPRILPKDFGWYVSAEAGHWFRDTSPYPSYTNWNAGVAFTWKQFTLDLRYSDTNRHDCDVPVAAMDHTPNRCGTSFIAKLAFDLTKANLAALADGSNKQWKTGKDAKTEEQGKADKRGATGEQAKADKQGKPDGHPIAAKPDQQTNRDKQGEKDKPPKPDGKAAKEKQAGSDKQVKTPWDIAFGGALMSDYNFRGISASDHRPAVSAYVEPRYDFSRSLQAYLSVATNSISLDNRAAAAVEIRAGVRPTFDRLALDFGFWEHWLPGGRCFNFQAPGGLCIPQLTVLYVNSVPAELSYWEVFGKTTYNVDKQLSFGARVAWTPSVLNSGAEATYVAGWAKYILPHVLPKDFGWFISAEAGHWFRDASPYPSYTNWNAGLAFTWKQYILDLHYSGTDVHDCEVAVTATSHTSNRCGASFIARLSFDLTRTNLK